MNQNVLFACQLKMIGRLWSINYPVPPLHLIFLSLFKVIPKISSPKRFTPCLHKESFVSVRTTFLKQQRYFVCSNWFSMKNLPPIQVHWYRTKFLSYSLFPIFEWWLLSCSSEKRTVEQSRNSMDLHLISMPPQASCLSGENSQRHEQLPSRHLCICVLIITSVTPITRIKLKRWHT